MRHVATAIFGFFLLLAFSHAGRDSKGTEFILGFMENKIWASGAGTDIDMFITTVSNTPVDVTLTMPLLDPDWRQLVTVSRGQIVRVQIPHAIVGKGVEKAGKGLWIRATDEVSVYVVNKETYSTDAFLAFPVDVLGTEYYAVTYKQDAELMVIATEDHTRVSITFPTSAGNTQVTYENVTYGNGDTLHVTLNRFEAFHILQETVDADLTGAHILSDKPVAAISGNKKVPVDPTEITSADHLTEMLMPVDTWGKRFLTFSTPERSRGDIFRIVSSEDNTTISMSNGENFTIYNAGHFRELDIPSGEYRTLTSDKPIYVVIFAKTFVDDGPNRGDPAMTYVIPKEQFASDYTWSTVKTPENKHFNNKLTVVIHSDDLDGLSLDGEKPEWAEQAPIPGSDGMLQLWTHVTPGSHNVFHADPAVTFMAIATGTEAYNSYAYPAGLRLALINAICMPSTPVAGDIVDNDCDGLIDEETLNGIDDDGDGRTDEDLAMPPRVDGNWGEWGDWGDCSLNCGGWGFAVRTRYCDNPPPANNGLACEGSSTETQRCYRKSCSGPGPVCTRLGRRCLANATCHTETAECTCPHGQHGDATIACVDTTHQLCTVDCDPKVLTWDGAKAPVNVPCWYSVGHFVTNIVSPPDLQYNKCSVDVLALNELTSDGLYYVRAVKVNLRFLYHDEAGNAVYRAGSTDFTITQEQIRAAKGNDPWKHRVETVNSVTVKPTWDGNDQFAILSIEQCKVQVKFRAHVPGELPQILKPGVTVVAPVETEFGSQSPSRSVCQVAGDGGDAYKEQAEALGLHNPAQAVLYNILQDRDIDHTDGNPDHGAECSALSDVMIGCDVSKRSLAVKLCTPILSRKSILSCLLAGHVSVMEPVKQCMNWVCFASIPDCNSYRANMASANCTTTRLMDHVGCDVTKLALKL